jgi:hypothetical protein
VHHSKFWPPMTGSGQIRSFRRCQLNVRFARKRTRLGFTRHVVQPAVVCLTCSLILAWISS